MATKLEVGGLIGKALVVGPLKKNTFLRLPLYSDPKTWDWRCSGDYISTVRFGKDLPDQTT